MSERIEEIRGRIANEAPAYIGYVGRVRAAEDVAFLLAEVERLEREKAELVAKVPEAWMEGVNAEAKQREGEWAVTLLCSVANPYLTWSEPDADGLMHSTPVDNPLEVDA